MFCHCVVCVIQLTRQKVNISRGITCLQCPLFTPDIFLNGVTWIINLWLGVIGRPATPTIFGRCHVPVHQLWLWVIKALRHPTIFGTCHVCPSTVAIVHQTPPTSDDISTTSRVCHQLWHWVIKHLRHPTIFKSGSHQLVAVGHQSPPTSDDLLDCVTWL